PGRPDSVPWITGSAAASSRFEGMPASAKVVAETAMSANPAETTIDLPSLPNMFLTPRPSVGTLCGFLLAAILPILRILTAQAAVWFHPTSRIHGKKDVCCEVDHIGGGRLEP